MRQICRYSRKLGAIQDVGGQREKTSGYDVCF